ncbi:transcriptional regulator, TetR family [Psychroflexus torquis ATCC 700755]|uniref:Transcriptional regulator, TetR family n=1 Tax=Psychroflexus torquis (strain ATCC 700755 / CIP 106069 / ACAM 623) TaxID=313595 RepID=K4IES1_PSYTT|nr:TetR/AcrR family transcriptional regulator [Psychroflexus torquis]AFU68358.1 transcriptional regulator, TetR family [Psychroflexus torquis ATCC 700755]
MITKDYIIEITTQLYLKNGVKAVTIADITKELSTSKRTIYNHFIDKTDLMQACIERYLAGIRSNNDEIINNCSSAIEAMGIIQQQILKRADYSNAHFYKDILRYFPSVLKDSYEKNSEFAFRELLYLAKWGVKDGLFRKDLDPEVTMATVQTLLKLCNNTKVFPSAQFSKARLTEGIMVVYLRGLCTEKGLLEVEKQKHLYLT